MRDIWLYFGDFILRKVSPRHATHAADDWSFQSGNNAPEVASSIHRNNIYSTAGNVTEGMEGIGLRKPKRLFFAAEPGVQKYHPPYCAEGVNEVSSSV